MNVLGVIRVVIELSSMINNDEVYAHLSNNKHYSSTLEYLKPKVKRSYLDNPRIVCERKVLQAEVDQGLDIKKIYTIDDVFENPKVFPEITFAADALAKLYQILNFYCITLKLDIKKGLRAAVSNNVYDCMSGGCSKYFLAACRHLIEKHGVDLDTYVYPKDNTPDWYTFRDFLREIEDIPRFEKLLKDEKYLLKGV